jgi:hypothetical protein
MPPTGTPPEDLKKLLEENIALAKDTNRLLREMRRNSIILAILKVALWLVILGVPLFFLSTYLAPVLDAVRNQGAASPLPGGIFGLPSQEQIDRLIEQYQAARDGA